MSYSSSSLDDSADTVGVYDTFDLLRWMQERSMTVSNMLIYNGSEPTEKLYPARDIRVNIPTGYKTVLDTEQIVLNTMYRTQYTYTQEVI